MKIRYVLISCLVVVLAGCNSSSNVRSNSDGKIVVTDKNFREIFPEKNARTTFLVRTLGPYYAAYRECVYYNASLADDGSKDISGLIRVAEKACDPYLRKVAVWMILISKRSTTYKLDDSYMVYTLKVVLLLARSYSRINLNKSRNGQNAKQPEHPERVIERIRRIRQTRGPFPGI